jgi:hypothetical protein
MPATARSLRRAAPARRTEGQAEPERSEPLPEARPALESGPAPARLPLPRRAFVVVGGVPGAGKSTLLHRLRVTSPHGRFSRRAEPGYAAVHTLTREDARTVVLEPARRPRRQS